MEMENISIWNIMIDNPYVVVELNNGWVITCFLSGNGDLFMPTIKTPIGYYSTVDLPIDELQGIGDLIRNYIKSYKERKKIK